MDVYGVKKYRKDLERRKDNLRNIKLKYIYSSEYIIPVISLKTFFGSRVRAAGIAMPGDKDRP